MRKSLTVDELAAGVAANSRPVVARAITLVESSKPADRDRVMGRLAEEKAKANEKAEEAKSAEVA